MCLAVPGKIISIDDSASLTRTGRIEFGGIVKEACLAFIPEAGIGDYVLVHAGIAISTIKEDEARRTFEYLDQINQINKDRS